MFGYVQAYKPEMKLCEYETYRAVYCSLCRCLGKEYGPFAKFILSYDFTFLAVLKLALNEDKCSFEPMRCMYHPLKECNKLVGEHEALSYSAACALIMVKYKLKDDMSDDGFKGKIKTALIYPFMSHAFKKATKKYPDVDAAVKKMTDAQSELEIDKCESYDRAAEPTASLLSFIFARDEKDPKNKRILNRIGYCVGKWIYLCDALDDAEDDLKKGNYNTILLKNRITEATELKQAKQDVLPLLRVCSSETAASFELLTLNRYQSILQNVIYLGMAETVKSLTKTQEETK